jgi:RNA polymerase sigma factor (sigma-70 family)
MASVRAGATWAQIQRLFGLGTVSGLSEWQLLERYALRRDEAAFAALVARHAPMVLGVCRRVLHDPEDVEDAFQATFLVLVRKAKVLRPHDAVGHWLYGVAYRVALRARSEAARRRSRERPAVGIENVADLTDKEPPDVDLVPILDEELKRLPASYRAAIVLCYLEGLTHEEAAGQLGWPVGTVKGRLARARALLRDRLSRRGLALTSGGVAALLSREAGAAVPAGWVDAVVKVAAGEAAGGLVSAAAVALAEGVSWAMFLKPWKIAASALAVLAAITAGAGALAQKTGANGNPVADPTRPTVPVVPAEGPPRATEEAAPAPTPAQPGADLEAPTPAQPGADLEAPKPADQFPFGSDVRTGFRLAFESYRMGRLDEETVHLWSRRLADAEAEAAGPTGRLKAAKGHLKRMEDLEQLARVRANEGPVRPSDVPPLAHLNARFYREQAERLVKTAGSRPLDTLTVTTTDGLHIQANEVAVNGPGTLTTSAQPAPGAGGQVPGHGSSKDARSLAAIKKLDDPVEMSFANETPLEDVLKYVKEVTKSPEFPKGIPIYVDPVGLQEAEKTLTSPIAIDLDGVPLRRTLHLLLRQLGLCYRVDDGMIYITAEFSEDAGPLPPPIRDPTPLMVMQERAEKGEMNTQERKEFIEMLKDLKTIDDLLHPEPRQGGKSGAGGRKGGGLQ